jgi:hypothetical protein
MAVGPGNAAILLRIQQWVLCLIHPNLRSHHFLLQNATANSTANRTSPGATAHVSYMHTSLSRHINLIIFCIELHLM